ncbi:hypothetical protein [Dyella japonica]|uniref:Uncharacterized protein n=1 Tax=Dyella japonica DSM 16301 TaxID=1440762 RepID=A0A0G9H8R1_9GAMM|nr:hypothetical protein [Dyella japonica]KLD64107.1 hypothetical protein Y882_08485 [Dyella japonica DSM 16301]
MADPLPTTLQRKALGALLTAAFGELRYLRGEQAHDLAEALRPLPTDMDFYGAWSVHGTRLRLQHYRAKYAAHAGFDYVGAFDAIFPPNLWS